MRADGRWLTQMWPTIRSHLPASPARILEVGCGRLGGFIPMLQASGYDAVGIDPVAPEGESYRRVEVERCELPGGLNAIIACTSLHHVGELGEVLDKLAAALEPDGVAVVVEWAWESFDEPTARWCFERLDAGESDSWLAHRRDGWAASEQGWEQYLHEWADGHGLHSGRKVVAELDQRFQRLLCNRAPFFFQDLSETSEADELDAIKEGMIQATRIDYVGRAR